MKVLKYRKQLNNSRCYLNRKLLKKINDKLKSIFLINKP